MLGGYTDSRQRGQLLLEVIWVSDKEEQQERMLFYSGGSKEQQDFVVPGLVADGEQPREGLFGRQQMRTTNGWLSRKDSMQILRRYG